MDNQLYWLNRKLFKAALKHFNTDIIFLKVQR